MKSWPAKRFEMAKAARKSARSKSGTQGNGSGAAAAASDQAARITMGLGEIMTVMMRSPDHRFNSLEDLEWLIIPPLLANQYTVVEARNKDSNIHAPVGVALWARVSEDVDKKLTDNLGKTVRLSQEEWTGGDILWVIDMAGPPQAVSALLEQMRESVFDGEPYKIRVIAEDGTFSIETVGANTE